MTDYHLCTCVFCSAQLRVESRKLGTEASCPKCGKRIRIEANRTSDSPPSNTGLIQLKDSEPREDIDSWIDDEGLTPEDAFRLAVRYSLSDGVLSVDEKQHLSALRFTLQISSEVAKRIFDEEKTLSVIQQTTEIKTVDTSKINKLLQLGNKSLEAGQPGEALGFFNKALEEDPENCHGWFGKALCVHASATLSDPPFDEMLVLFQHAIDSAPAQARHEMEKRAAQRLVWLARDWFEFASDHLEEHAAIPSTWENFVRHSLQAMTALQVAIEKLDYPAPVQLLLKICDRLLEGVSYSSTAYGSGVRHVSHEMADLLRSQREWCAARIRKYLPNFELPKLERASRCFVVTAALGDSQHPDVVTLRDFRDEWLSQRLCGRYMIRVYYRVGPTLATVVKSSPLLRITVVAILIEPACFLVRRWIKPSIRLGDSSRGCGHS